MKSVIIEFKILVDSLLNDFGYECIIPYVFYYKDDINLNIRKNGTMVVYVSNNDNPLVIIDSEEDLEAFLMINYGNNQIF